MRVRVPEKYASEFQESEVTIPEGLLQSDFMDWWQKAAADERYLLLKTAQQDSITSAFYRVKTGSQYVDDVDDDADDSDLDDDEILEDDDDDSDMVYAETHEGDADEYEEDYG